MSSFDITADIRYRHGKLFVWMQRNNLKNSELSRLTGINPSVLGAIINMQKPPSKKCAEMLSLVTGIPKDELFPVEYVTALRKRGFSKLHTRQITESIPLGDMLDWGSREPLPSPEEACVDAETFEQLEKAINELPARPRQVMLLRFKDEKTLKEVGAIIGVTVERVRQIEKRTLECLRDKLEEVDKLP